MNRAIVRRAVAIKKSMSLVVMCRYLKSLSAGQFAGTLKGMTPEQIALEIAHIEMSALRGIA